MPFSSVFWTTQPYIVAIVHLCLLQKRSIKTRPIRQEWMKQAYQPAGSSYSDLERMNICVTFGFSNSLLSHFSHFPRLTLDVMHECVKEWLARLLSPTRDLILVARALLRFSQGFGILINANLTVGCHTRHKSFCSIHEATVGRNHPNDAYPLDTDIQSQKSWTIRLNPGVHRIQCTFPASLENHQWMTPTCSPQRPVW